MSIVVSIRDSFANGFLAYIPGKGFDVTVRATVAEAHVCETFAEAQFLLAQWVTIDPTTPIVVRSYVIESGRLHAVRITQSTNA